MRLIIHIFFIIYKAKSEKNIFFAQNLHFLENLLFLEILVLFLNLRQSKFQTMERTPYLILLLLTPTPPQGHCVLMAPDPLTGHCGVVSALLILMFLFSEMKHFR